MGALDAAWWAALGAASRWGPTYTGLATITRTYSPTFSGVTGAPDWLAIGVSLGAASKFFQAPLYAADADGGDQGLDNSYDTGFFYLTDNTGDDRYPSMCCIPGEPNTKGYGHETHSQCAELVPLNKEGELRPMSAGYPIYSAYYKTGFVYYIGSNANVPHDDLVIWMKCPARGAEAYFHHYVPFAWADTPPAVIASILLQVGLPVGYIDTAAFATAHDALRDSTMGDILIGGTAGPDVSWEPVAYCSRHIGQKVIDLVADVARHHRDLYYVNEAGVLDVSSFTRPADTVAGLDLDDGVLNVDWQWSTRYVFNKVAAGWGSGYRFSGSPTYAPDAGSFTCQQEDELDSYQDSKYVHEASDATSVAKYGEIWLKGRERTTPTSGGRKVSSSHYPFYLGPGCTQAQWEDDGFGGMMHVTAWLKSDAKERRIVTVTQDFRALDWGIGSLLTNVQVTDDGAVIPEMWCIERTYDFDRLTVTSVLMERPPNT